MRDLQSESALGQARDDIAAELISDNRSDNVSLLRESFNASPWHGHESRVSSLISLAGNQTLGP
jgi:hypothetical protein